MKAPTKPNPTVTTEHYFEDFVNFCMSSVGSLPALLGCNLLEGAHAALGQDPFYSRKLCVHLKAHMDVMRWLVEEDSPPFTKTGNFRRQCGDSDWTVFKDALILMRSLLLDEDLYQSLELRTSGDRGKHKRHEEAGASSKKQAKSSASVAVGVGGIEKS